MRILERDAELEQLDAALHRAGRGSGSVVLVSGEAGIGKTSVVRTFLRMAAGRARILAGSCDDLIAPRTFGPLRDGVPDAWAGVRVALAADDRDGVLTGMLAALACHGRPTLFVVEDLHWADDATLDLVRYLGRRIEDLSALVVVTYREEETNRALERVLGSLGGAAVTRLTLGRLSRAAVAKLSGGTAVTSAGLYRLTAGNPFFVSEALAAPDAVPATVVDAVLARVRRLEPVTQAALEQLAVVPSRVELVLARALLGGDLQTLAEAERRGVLEVRPTEVAFRHELARRALESSLPATTRMQLNARVLALLTANEEPDLSRVVHHAVGAGDDAMVIDAGLPAALQANRAGAHAQEIDLYEELLRRRRLLGRAREADVLQACAMAMATTGRLDDALRRCGEAVRIREESGDGGALGTALVTLAQLEWALGRAMGALEVASRAVALLAPDGDSRRHAWALTQRGALLTAAGAPREALATGSAAVEMAEGLGAPELLSLALVVRGTARLQLGEDDGLEEVLRGIATAAGVPHHQHVMTGYACLVPELWRLGRFAEAQRWIEEGAAYADERQLDLSLDVLRSYRHRVHAMRGQWDAAESGLRAMRRGGDGAAWPGLATLALLAVRRGAQDAEELVTRARDHARRTGSRYEVVPAALAEVEYAWSRGRRVVASDALEVLEERTRGTGAVYERGALQRWRRRLGLPADTFPGCPEEFSLGMAGDWRGAAAAWERIGAPFEQALELAGSGEVEPTTEALRILDGLGARPTAARVRRQLRDMGVTRIPRGPQSSTRAHPMGLTERQTEILVLLGSGATNAEIAARLVLSVRTVDHHVSAVLQKLGVTSRREAVLAARSVRNGPR